MKQTLQYVSGIMNSLGSRCIRVMRMTTVWIHQYLINFPLYVLVIFTTAVLMATLLILATLMKLLGVIMTTLEAFMFMIQKQMNLNSYKTPLTSFINFTTTTQMMLLEQVSTLLILIA